MPSWPRRSSGALGAGLLPEAAIPYLGLLPLLLGLRAAWRVWHEHRQGSSWKQSGDEADQGSEPRTDQQPSPWSVATVTIANGGHNIGVYVPVFATAGAAAMVTYVATFLLLVAVWCAAGWHFASRPLVAKALSRWGHIIPPVVLIGIGLVILIEGGAFGL